MTDVKEDALDPATRAVIAEVRHYARLTPMERARGLAKYRSLTGLSVAKVAARFDLSEANVYTLLALLDAAEEVQRLADSGALGTSVAYQVGRIPDHGRQVEVARRIVAEDLTREQAIRLVLAALPSKKKAARKRA